MTLKRVLLSREYNLCRVDGAMRKCQRAILGYQRSCSSSASVDSHRQQTPHPIENKVSGTSTEFTKINVSSSSRKKLDWEKGPSLGHFMQQHDHDRGMMGEKTEAGASSQMSFPQQDQLLENSLPIISTGKKFFIETYGCQMNTSDSEIVRAILLGNGYVEVEDYLLADAIFVNTCAIRENAESRIWNRLEEFKHHKKRLLHSRMRDVVRPPIVGVLGCMAERLKKTLLESDKMVDIVAGPDAYRDLPNLLRVVQQGEGGINVQLSLDETYADIAPVRSNPTSPSAYVSIMRGCNNMCSYCIVPFTRGRERSRDIPSIIDEIRRLSDQGVKEVVLLGQNVNSYHDKHSEGANKNATGYTSAVGFDNMFKLRHAPGYRFADLLDQVSMIDPEMRIRFTSPHPKDFPDAVLDLIQERHNICKSIHIPVQSGSSSVLQRMRRNYTREAYVDLVAHMRERIPGVALSSDFISGFCGETEEEHHETVSLMEQVCYDQAFMFAYSLRDRTHASHRLEDNVEEAVKQRRLRQVIDTFGKFATEKNRLQETGRLQLVLLEGVSRRSTEDKIELSGRTDTNKRCNFASATVPSSIRSFLQVNHLPNDIWSNFQPTTNITTQPKDDDMDMISLARGDYALVYVDTAGRHTLHVTPLARTTLVEANELIPSHLLGSREHNLAAFFHRSS